MKKICFLTIFLVTIAYGGIHVSSPPRADLTTATGILSLDKGGSNKDLTALNGGICYSDIDSLELSIAGTSGQALVSGGTGTPTWFSPTSGSLLFSGPSGILAQDNTNLFWDKALASLGIGTNTPSSILHVKANAPGTVGDGPAGQVIIQALGTSINSNAIITGYNSNQSGDPNNQLWYLGSSSSSNQNITFLNRISGSLALGTNGLTRFTVTSVGNIENTNFTKLGSAAPSIKMAKLTGTGGTVEGWNTNVAHGLGDISKIISADVLLTAPNGNIIPPGFTTVAEFQYDFFIDSTNILVRATATNSSSILLSSAFVILLTLEE